MDQSVLSGGIFILVNSREAQSLVEWNAEYEAFSVRNDWWFKAGEAVIGWVRSAVEAIATRPETAPRLAHA